MLIEHGASDKHKIMIVDDEQAVLESLVDLLYRDYHVYATDEPEVAFKLLSKLDIALLLCDQRMPKISGSAVLAKAAQINPVTIRVLLTAYSDLEALIQSVNEGKIMHYLAKPWDSQQLLKFIQRTVESYILVTENRRMIRRIAELTEATGCSDVRRTETFGLQDALLQDNTALRVALNHIECSSWCLGKIRDAYPMCKKCGAVMAEDQRWMEIIRLVEENQAFLSQGICSRSHAKHDERRG